MLAQSGFFSGAREFQISGCEMSEHKVCWFVHVGPVTNTLLLPTDYQSSIFLRINYYLCMDSIKRLILSHGGYLYRNKLYRHLDGDAKLTSQTWSTNALTTSFIQNQQIRDLASLINVLLFCFLIFRKFIVRH